MYNRFRDSIVSPAKLVDYRNDKLIGVFAYILFFALLLSTRMIIDVITYDGLSVADQTEIAAALPDLDPTCGITDSYVCDAEETTLLYEDLIIKYYLESNPTLQFDNYDSQYSAVIHNDKLYLIFGNTVLYEELIETALPELIGLDFSLQQSDPDAFEAQIFSAIDTFVLGYKTLWGIGLIVVDYLTGIILFFAFILLSALMMRFRFREIPYRHLFVMTAYSSTALYLILIFNSLFQLNFLLVFLLIIIAFRQNSQLSLEILRRLKTKEPKQ